MRRFKLTPEQTKLVAESSFLVFYGILAFNLFIFIILPMLLIYLIAARVKSTNLFFLITLVIFLSTNVWGITGVFNEERGGPLLISALTISVLTSLLLTYLWKSIFIEKKYSIGFVLIIPILLTILIGLNESPNSTIFNLFVSLGNYLKDVSGYKIDIFLYDFAGFAILFVNFVNLVITSALLILLKSRLKYIDFVG